MRVREPRKKGPSGAELRAAHEAKVEQQRADEAAGDAIAFRGLPDV